MRWQSKELAVQAGYWEATQTAMTSKELFSVFEKLETALERNQYLLDAIRSLSNFNVEITELHSRALLQTQSHESHNALDITRQKLRHIIQQTKKLSPKRIFAEIHTLINSLTQTESELDAQTLQKLDSLKKELETFGEVYEAFISAQQLGETAKLLSTAQRVDAAINSSIEFASVVLKNLCPGGDLTSSEDQLAIYLPSEKELLAFVEKVSAIEHIYDEMCQLFNVSTKQEPLRIVKIESGSLWAWIKGNPIVIPAIKSAIEKAAHYLYRNHTVEGRISSIPKKAETIESVLHLSDELKKRNISTEQIDDHIKKASVLVSNELEKLLSGEEELELNGILIPLTPSSQQKLISAKHVKLIEDGKPQE